MNILHYFKRKSENEQVKTDQNKKLKMEILEECRCSDHCENYPRWYYKGDVLCKDCCDGYCPYCCFHNGHSKQTIDGELLDCKWMKDFDHTYRPTTTTKCNCEY